MKNRLLLAANSLIIENAKSLRYNMTDAENLLCGHIKGNQLGVRFRRQHPIGYYIADFYCHTYKLIIELDGSIHNDPEVLASDFERQKYLESIGLRVIRFTNDEVFKNLEKVLTTIDQHINPATNEQDC